MHSPTLKTVLMVEDVLKNSGEPIKRTEIKKRLKKKMMHQTLNQVLDYLEDRNMIIDHHKGVLWTHNPNKGLKKAIEVGLKI